MRFLPVHVRKGANFRARIVFSETVQPSAQKIGMHNHLGGWIPGIKSETLGDVLIVAEGEGQSMARSMVRQRRKIEQGWGKKEKKEGKNIM
jgi:hypothetical protein